MTDQQTNEKDVIVLPKPQIVEEPGFGLAGRNVVFTIAGRLVKHYKGKVAGGWNPSANGFVGKNDLGDLLPDDALYAAEYALSHGVNPIGDIHLWYIKGKLIIDIHWRIIKGWAEMVAPFRTEFFDMTDEQRQGHGLKPGDIGVIGYNILDSDKEFYRSMLMEAIQGGLKPSQANREVVPLVAKGSSIGIVLKSETKHAPAKGRSHKWRAEIRSFRGATGMSHGNRPPAQVKAYAEGQGIGFTAADLPTLAEPIMAELKPPEQRRYLELHADLRENKAKWGAMTSTELVTESQANINLMRGTIEEEETALGEEEVSEGIIEKEPTPEPAPEAEVKRLASIIGNFDWGTASRKLAFQCPAYALENGKPNMSKILTEAWALGFKQIHKDNVNDVLAALSDVFNQPTEGVRANRSTSW